MENIQAEVISRLFALGYAVDQRDYDTIDYNIKKAEAYLIINLGHDVVPESIRYIWVDMSAGLYLKEKMSLGETGGNSFSPIVKSIQEGDTNVTYNSNLSGTSEDKFYSLIESLIHPDKDVLSRYRRLTW